MPLASYDGVTLDDVRKDMDERYAEGRGYDYQILWDVQRHEQLHGAVLSLVEECLVYRDRSSRIKLADVGCGLLSSFDKPAFREWLKRFKGVQLVFNDISEKALERQALLARERSKAFVGSSLATLYADTPAENLRPYLESASVPCPCCEDMEALDWCDLDVVVSVESIEHWIDVEAALAGIHESMAPNGLFVLTTPNRDSLHVRMARRMGREVPFCAHDHTHEFGHAELDKTMKRSGFVKVAERGVGFVPYWGLEALFDPGDRIRALTDNDAEVIGWMDAIGARCPEFAFCQAKAYRKV